MSTPKEMKVVFTYEDGTRKEVDYQLSPLRSGDNPHQAGYVGEPGGSYTEVIGAGHGFHQSHRSDRLLGGGGNL